jgi:3-methyladenine DNA glycosylase AlkC
MWRATSAAAGKEIPVSQPSEDRGRRVNAEHAQEYADVTKEEAIKLLEDTCADAVVQLRRLTDEQLDVRVPWRQPYEPVPEQDVASARLLVEWNLIYHRYDHLAQIKTVLGIK